MKYQKRQTYPELQFDPEIPPELHLLLDPPPVLDKDDAELHQLTFMGFAHVVQPRDFIEWIYVRDAADHRCEITWLRRLKTRLVRRPRKYFEIDLFTEYFRRVKLKSRKWKIGPKLIFQPKSNSSEVNRTKSRLKLRSWKWRRKLISRLQLINFNVKPGKRWKHRSAQFKPTSRKLIFLNSGSNYISKWTTICEELNKNSRTISATSTSIDRDSGRASARRRRK
jgi:hypothetical protein